MAPCALLGRADLVLICLSELVVSFVLTMSEAFSISYSSSACIRSSKSVTVLPELRADHRRSGERASRVIMERMGSGG